MSEPPDEPPNGTLCGEVVAGHKLTRVIGAGGMGEVYLARHQALGMMRAVKVIRGDMIGRETANERFAREAKVLVRLQHSSIVQIVDYGSLAGGMPFLVMEYIEGPSLAELLQPGPLPLPAALVVLERVADALAYAHKLGVIHRDLKPENMVVRDGDVRQVKLIDFGFARLLDPDVVRITADGHMIGSPLYMAPEQIEGERDEVTGAADIYALAGIAYTMISGKPPFEGSYVELMEAHLGGDVPRLSTRCPEIPQRLDNLTYACFARAPEARPTSEEFADEIAKLVHGAEMRRRAGSSPALAIPDTSPRPTHSIDTVLAETAGSTDHVAAGLAAKIMRLVFDIAGHLSHSDPELMPLLRFEARISEQLTAKNGELAAIEAQVQVATGRHAEQLQARCDNLREQIRTLEAQQLPLQRRMIAIAERYRPYANAPMREVFDTIDRLLAELDEHRRKSVN